MAKVQISKWDIASAFGLRHEKTTLNDDTYLETYHYDFHGKSIVCEEDYYNVSDLDTANEYAAEQVLDMIAKAAVSWDKNVVKNG